MPTGNGRPVLTKTAYAVGVVLMLTPVVNFVSAWPVRLGAADWRFQQFGTLAAGLAPATLGLAIALYTARALDHRRTQGVIGVLGLLGAAAVAGLLVNFGLDALELRAIIAREGKGPVLQVALKAVTQSVVVAVALTLLGVTGARAWRRPARLGRPAEQLLVPRPAQQAAQ